MLILLIGCARDVGFQPHGKVVDGDVVIGDRAKGNIDKSTYIGGGAISASGVLSVVALAMRSQRNMAYKAIELANAKKAKIAHEELSKESWIPDVLTNIAIKKVAKNGEYNPRSKCSKNSCS